AGGGVVPRDHEVEPVRAVGPRGGEREGEQGQAEGEKQRARAHRGTSVSGEEDGPIIRSLAKARKGCRQSAGHSRAVADSTSEQLLICLPFLRTPGSSDPPARARTRRTQTARKARPRKAMPPEAARSRWHTPRANAWASG